MNDFLSPGLQRIVVKVLSFFSSVVVTVVLSDA